MIVAGYFEGELAIDDNSRLTTVRNHSDAFVVRFDDGGVVQWSFSFGAERNDNILDIAADDDGGFTVAGRYSSRELVLGSGQPNETVLTNVDPDASENYEGFVARFDRDGALRVARQITGIGTQYATRIVASDSYSMLAGQLEGETVFWDGHPEAVTVRPAGGATAGFLMRMGP
jgi:hypothetical protein